MVVVTLPAEIDLANSGRAFRPLYAALDSGDDVVIADFSATEFCDSSAIYHLLTVNRQAAARQIQLRLAAPPDGPPRRVMELLEIDRMIPIYASIAEAAAGPDGP